jgi:N-acyl-D-amino-acid deacylase
MPDLIIQNVQLLDGTGFPPRTADVAIENGRIAYIEARNAKRQLVRRSLGEVGTPNAKRSDAEGAYLAPGFIDSHTHDDLAVLHHPDHPAKLRQGVTTVVVGNCSFSNYPTAGNDDLKQHLGSLLGDIESDDLFPDFASYKNRLQKTGISLNVVSLVGHGSLRLAVMGFEQREPTETELENMCRLLEKQLRQGAHGLSLGLVYPPSAFAGRGELVRLAQVVRQYDRLVAAHIRSYEGGLLTSIAEFLDVLRESKAKGLLSHLQVAGKPYWGKMPAALKLLDEARQQGIDINVDMYPYLAGSSTILQLLPPSAQEGGFSALLDRLDDPAQYAAIQKLTELGPEPHSHSHSLSHPHSLSSWESKVALIGWDNVRIGSAVHPEIKQYEGKSIGEAARLSGLTPFEFTVHAIRMDQGRTNIIMFQLSDEDLKCVHQYPVQMVGSDSIPRCGGRPHPRMFGSFPKVVGRFALQEGLFSLEEAIRRMTSLPAQRFQLADRGVIRPGAIADLVLFNDNFLDRATFEEPEVFPSGLLGVWVNGVRVVNGNEILSERPGRVLHH